MRYLFLAVAATLGLCGNLRAADPPKDLTLVPNDALAFASVSVATVWDHPAFKGLRTAAEAMPVARELEEMGLKLEDVERCSFVLLPPHKEGVARRFQPETLGIVTTRKTLDQAKLLKKLQLYGTDEGKEIEATRKPGEKPPPPNGKTGQPFYFKGETVVAFVGDRTFVIWETVSVPKKVSDLISPLDLLKSAAATGPLSEGLALAAEHPVAVGLNPLAVKNALANDPPPDDILPLFRADTVAGYVKLGKEVANVALTATFAGKQWAEEGEDAAKQVKTLLAFLMKDQAGRTLKREGKESALGNFYQALGTAVDKAAVKRTGNAVTMTDALDLGPKVQALLAALPQATSESALAAKSTNNLKQIAIAYHAYHDANGHGVANSLDADGKPLLSWRVHVLPYLEQQALYNQFKLNEPWDSETNKKLIEKMPPVFAMPGVKTKEAGRTFYQGFSMTKTAVGRPIFVETDKKGIRFPAVTDGLSNTFLCVEAADPVAWTKPEDLPFDPNGKLPKLGGHFANDRFHALFADGSTRLMSATMPEAKLKAYITINGGEVITED